ncbi:hypothetical protein D3C84_1266840 [compost metagenome]
MYPTTLTAEVGVLSLTPKLSSAINCGKGSQLSLPFVKLKVVIAVLSDKVGEDNVVAQEARTA